MKTQLQIALEREQAGSLPGGLIDKAQGIPNFQPSYFYGSFRMSEGQTQGFDEKKPYAGHSWIYICSHKIATQLKRVPHKLAKRNDEGTDEEEHIYKHPILQSLKKPNPWMSRTTFWESIVLALMLPTQRSTGGQVFLIPATLGGQKVDLTKGNIPDVWFPYDDNWVTPHVEDGQFRNWVWQPPNKANSQEGKIYYENSELIRIYNYNPYDSFRGMAPFVPVKFAVLQDSEASQFNYHFFKNSANLTGTLSGDLTMTPQQRSEIARSWNELYAGSHKAGSVAVLGNGLKFQAIQQSHLDMQFSEMKEINRDEVIAAYGLNELAFGKLRQIPYSNVIEGIKMLWNETYCPIQDHILESINEQWVQYVDPTLILEADYSEVPAMKADLDQRVKIGAIMISQMQIPIAEAIRIVGIDIDTSKYPYMADKPQMAGPSFGSTPTDKPAPEEDTEPPAPEKKPKGKVNRMLTEKSMDEKHIARNTEIAHAYCKAVLDPGEKKMVRMFSRFFADQRNGMMAKVDNWARSKKSIEKISERPSPEIFLFDLTDANDELVKQYKPQVKNQMERTADALEEELPDGLTAWSVNDDSIQAFTALRRDVLEGINTTTLNSARDEISEVIADSFEQGLTSAETAERIKDAVYDVSGVRISNAGMISRTEIGSITQMAKLEAYRAEEVEYWEWITARDDKVRDTHLIDGEVVRVGEPFSNGLIMPLDPDGSPDEVCNCFLGDMVPESPNGISKVFRNWYQGDIITLNFADGFDITGTPKHPILTRDGWVPLGELQKGDQVLKFFNAKDSRFGDVNIKHMVPQFSELYNSFSKVGTAMRIPGINVNFHGDFSASEVDVVGVGSHLWDESDSVFLKEQADLILSEPDLRKRMLSLQSLFYFGRDPRLFGHTADSLMGSRAEGTSLLRGGLIHSEEHGVTPISYNNTGSNKSGTYSTTGHPIFGSDSFLGHASKIVTGDRHVVEAKVTGRHVKTSVEREVFNLESHTGIYICNDVIVHNCRCLTVFANNPSGGN